MPKFSTRVRLMTFFTYFEMLLDSQTENRFSIFQKLKLFLVYLRFSTQPPTSNKNRQIKLCQQTREKIVKIRLTKQKGFVTFEY